MKRSIIDQLKICSPLLAESEYDKHCFVCVLILAVKLYKCKNCVCMDYIPSNRPFCETLNYQGWTQEFRGGD
jgi:hypothetical protein